MRSKLPAFIALLCILVYAGALLYGAYRVYTSIESQKQLAVRELDGIQSRITQSGSDFFTEPFREHMRITMANCKALEGIIITGPQGNQSFEKSAGSVIRLEPTIGFIPRFGFTTLPVKQLEMPGFRNVNILSAFNTINYEELVLVLRETLYAILGALVLSFLTMMITILRSRTTVYAESSYTDNKREESQTDLSDDYFSESGFDSEETESKSYEDDYSVSENLQTKDGDLDDVFDLPDFDSFSDADTNSSGDDDFHLDDFLDEGDLELPVSEHINEKKPEVPQSSSSPNGLYSPRTNIGWEAYTQDRLASELHRCASSEQDLVVLVMECGDGVNCDGKLIKKIADEAVKLFNLRDLSFEHGSRGITVIIPNAGLEQGISKAETFHARILESCYDNFHSRNDFNAGISSRSGRLIAADRLLLEAEKALEKAKTDSGSPIVAFKSDPEKYREYLKKAK